MLYTEAYPETAASKVSIPPLPAEQHNTDKPQMWNLLAKNGAPE